MNLVINLKLYPVDLSFKAKKSVKAPEVEAHGRHPEVSKAQL
jgi:hypothetical protein